MISIKALRPTRNAEHSIEEPYRKGQDDASGSRWPVAAAAIVLAVAAYLRSLFPGEARQEASAFGQGHEGDDPANIERRANDAEFVSAMSQDEEARSRSGEDEPDRGKAIGSGSPTVNATGLAAFLGVDSPPIDYEQLPLPRFTGWSGIPGGGEGARPSGFATGALPGLSPSPSGGGGNANDNEGGDDDDDPGTEEPTQRNRAPRLVSAVQLGEIGPCQTLLITAVALLAGTIDADGDTLTVRNLRASSGTLTAVEGGWEYKPAADYFGPVTLTYGVSDGTETVAQTAGIAVVELLTLNGTSGDDILVGTECADLIQGRGGNDSIEGRGGSDIIHGGDGHDRLFGGAGNDILFGDAGNDLLMGGEGNDQLSGGDGNDELHGEGGNDVLAGGAGDDLALGGDGDDMIDGGTGNDTLRGGAGDDHLIGGSGNDTVEGGDGDDIIAVSDGDNEIDGGEGDNIITTGTGRSRISAGNGDNTLVGGSGVDIAQLGSGRDVARLGAGDDTLAAGAGDDRVFGEDGNDTLLGEAGADHLDGGDGNDTLSGGVGEDRLAGGDGQDILDAGDGDDEIEGGGGNDIVLAGTGDDDVQGDAGNDALFGAAGDDILDGGTGDDVIHGEAGADCLAGGQGNDALFGGAGNDALQGGEGNDLVDAGAGSDTVAAGSGDDVVLASLDAGADCYDGGSGTDTLDLAATTAGVIVDLEQGKALGIEIGSDTVLNFEAIIAGEGDDHLIVGGQGVSVTGGRGRDTFAFAVPEDAEPDLIHQILDLEEGDRIIVKQYEIRSVQDNEGQGSGGVDPFAETYGDLGTETRPFRFRIEKIGENERTYVDVYVEQAEDKDFSIEIYGNHKLYYY